MTEVSPVKSEASATANPATPTPTRAAGRGSAAIFSADHLRFPRLWFWLGVLMVATVVVLSLIDPPKVVKSVFSKDKLIHCFVYACLMGWFAQIFRQHGVRVFFAVLFIAMGVGIEYLQGILPLRQFDVMDMLANTLGVLLAWALCYTWIGGILVWFERHCLRFGTYISG